MGEVQWSRLDRGQQRIFTVLTTNHQPGAAFQKTNLNQKVFYHQLETDQSQDVLVYKRPDEPTWGFGLSVSEDGRYLVITIWKGTDNKYRIVVKDLTEPHGMPVDVIENFDHEYSFIGNDETTFYFSQISSRPENELSPLTSRFRRSFVKLFRKRMRR